MQPGDGAAMRLSMSLEIPRSLTRFYFPIQVSLPVEQE